MLDVIIFLVVGFLCFSQGIKTYQMEEQNKVFSKYPIRVTDVKKYNQFCGKLMIGFGVVAELTLIAMTSFDGWISTVFALSIIVEAVILMKIYRNGEKKFIKK